MTDEGNDKHSYVPGLSGVEIANFERWATELLHTFERRPDDEPISLSYWQPQRIPTFESNDKNIIGPLVVQEPDQSTFEIKSIQIATESGLFDLEYAGCRLLDQLAERWATHPRLHGLSNQRAMRKRLIDWCAQVLQSGRFSACVGYIQDRLREEVGSHEVWVKLADIDVQDRMPMGAVELRGIEPVQIDTWLGHLIQKGLDESKQNPLRNVLEREWQGETAAVFRKIGDVISVEDLAFEHTERACAMLRMVEPGNMSAIQRSYLQPLTLVSQMGIRAMLTDPESAHFSRSSRVAYTPPCGLVIEKERFPELWERGYLKQLHELLIANPPTPFQKHLVRAILIYSRHRLASDPVEKLIFAFSGLETMLLGADKRARIRSTIKRRFGAALGNNKTESKDLEQLINHAYDLRSEFLHHGVLLRDQHLIQQFLLNSWAYFLRLIENHSRWHTIGNYCVELDTKYKPS